MIVLNIGVFILVLFGCFAAGFIAGKRKNK